MNILITGANGFVGSHITEALVEQGHKVFCLVRKSSNLKWIKNLNIEYKYGDITDTAQLPEIVADVDVIVHTAGVLRALEKKTYYDVNQHAAARLAEAVVKYNPGLKKFILISSLAAMGPSSSIKPKTIYDINAPVSDYGKSKLAGEIEIENIFNNKIPYTILRPAAVYGPRDKDIFIFFKLVNMGFHLYTPKKKFFQLVFVKDISAAVINSINNKKSINKTYILAEKTPYTWCGVSKIIAETADRKTLPLPLPDIIFKITAFFIEKFYNYFGKAAVLNRQKANEMLQLFWLGDTVEATEELGITFTKLNFGAKITYLWYKNNNWF